MENSYELVITVNVTCLMVLASIYLSISDRCPLCNNNYELFSFSQNLLFCPFLHTSRPPSTSITTIDIWLLFNLAFPFLVIMVNILLQVTSQIWGSSPAAAVVAEGKRSRRKSEKRYHNNPKSGPSSDASLKINLGQLTGVHCWLC